MANPITGFQLAQQGVNLSSSASAPTPASQQPRPNPTSGSVGAPPIFRYPLEKMLEDYTDYVKITSYEYKPPGVGGLSNTNFNIPTSDTNYRSLGIKDIKATWLLPIPQNVPNNSQSASWGEGKLSPLTAAAIGAAQKTISSQNPFSEGVGQINSILSKIGKSVQTGIGQNAIETYFASKAIEQLTGQSDLFGELLSRNSGAVINENVELLFRGVNLREAFALNFDLAPRDNKEAQEIKKMIVFLKSEMSPRKGTSNGAAGGLFLTAPHVFKVEYMSGKKNHPYLNRYKICALTALGVNFTPENTYATYSDGTPVHMQLSLTFQELTPIYAEDYDPNQNPEASIGVGY